MDAIDEDDVSCGVCLEVFNLPTVLPSCSHIFCRPCALSIASQAAALCPMCRAAFGLPLGPVDEHMVDLVRQFEKQNATPASSEADEVIVPPPWIRKDEWMVVLRHLERDGGGAASVATVGRVCKGLHRVAQDPFLWRELCIRDFAFVPDEHEMGQRASWRRRYDSAKKRSRGWKEGRPQDWKLTTLRGPASHVVQLEARGGHRVGVRYANDSAVVWDARSQVCHPDDAALRAPVTQVAVDASHSLRLVNNNALELWGANDAVLASVPLVAGSGHMPALSYHQNHVVVGGDVTAVYSVNFVSAPPVLALKSVLCNVRSNCVHIEQRRVVSGHVDNCIRVFDIENPAKPLYCLLGGSNRPRPDQPPHPDKPGCSAMLVDNSRIVAAFGSVVKCFALAE